MLTVGFHLEGTTDEAVFKVLLARLLGVSEEQLTVEVNPVRAHGIGDFFSSLPKAIQKFWYLGASAVVVGVDNDGENIVGEEDPRRPRHWCHDDRSERCRYCRCERAVERALACLRQVRDLAPRAWPVVISVPVEALEAWLLEEAQVVGKRQYRPAEGLPKSRLKTLLYGRPRPTAHDVRTIALPIAEGADLDSLRLRSRSFALFADAVLACRDAILAS